MFLLHPVEDERQSRIAEGTAPLSAAQIAQREVEAMRHLPPTQKRESIMEKLKRQQEESTRAE